MVLLGLWLLVGLLALVLVVSYGSLIWQRASPGDGVVLIRNLSGEAITLTSEQPGPFLVPRTETHVIQPWHEGICTDAFGYGPGRIKLTVSGSNIASATSYDTTIASDNVQPTIAVEIEADGAVRFGVTLPPDKPPCTVGRL